MILRFHCVSRSTAFTETCTHILWRFWVERSLYYQFFFKENVRYPVWTCRDPISLILWTRFSILRTRIGSLKRLKKSLPIIIRDLIPPQSYPSTVVYRLKRFSCMFDYNFPHRAKTPCPRLCTTWSSLWTRKRTPAGWACGTASKRTVFTKGTMWATKRATPPRNGRRPWKPSRASLF